MQKVTGKLHLGWNVATQYNLRDVLYHHVIIVSGQYV